MHIWYDTEFIDDGERIKTLSIGMVREDGKTYYAVVQDLALMQEAWDTLSNGEYWLRKNVMKYLPVKADANGKVYWDGSHPDFIHVKPRKQIAKEIKRFCTEKGTPTLWAWYAAYDHVALSQFFGRMISLPEDMPMYTLDLKQEHHRLGFPRLPAHVGEEHNALADAQWNRLIHEYMMKFEESAKRATGIYHREIN